MSNNIIKILGVTQDSGYPQIGCKKKCCKVAWENLSLRKMPACIAIIDKKEKKQWIIDATPDIKIQLRLLQQSTKIHDISGVFLTHAHIGHYLGLSFFGKESANATSLPVYAMEKMSDFLKKNAPWSQLVDMRNIKLNLINDQEVVKLSKNISIKPILVPHRNEFSETVGYIIQTEKKKLLYIPDIDSWKKWTSDIISIIKEVDYAIIDGTFMNKNEINRNLNDIPHPFIEDSIELFSNLSKKNKNKIFFTHFNHTNLLLSCQKEVTKLKQKGFNIAEQESFIFL